MEALAQENPLLVWAIMIFPPLVVFLPILIFKKLKEKRGRFDQKRNIF